jgi:hypothetical protein
VSVVIADIDPVGGEQTVVGANERGGEGMFVRTDILQADEVDELLARTVDARSVGLTAR